MLDILNFLGGATSLDFFRKAYKTSETTCYFPYERFDDPEKLNNFQLPPCENSKANCATIVPSQQKKMHTIKDLRWCNNKDVIPTPEATQKMNDFQHKQN